MIENISFVRKKNKVELFLRRKETHIGLINSGKTYLLYTSSIRIFCLFLHQPDKFSSMSGGIGHVLIMIQSVKNNRNLIKKRKSFKELKKNFENNPVPKSPNNAQLSHSINMHKGNIRFYERYRSVWGYILLGLVVVLISLYFFSI